MIMDAKNKQNLYIMAGVVILTLLMLFLHRLAITQGILTEYGFEREVPGECAVQDNLNQQQHLNTMNQGL